MKKYARILSVILVVAILICAQAISPSAARRPYHFGDVDCSYSIEITDATMIQRHLSQLSTLTDAQIFLGDVDRDNKLSVIDATHIQKDVAGYEDDSETGDYCFIDLYAKALISDYSSGLAATNVPVTFTAISGGGPSPVQYTFYVDGEIKREADSDNTFVYTFNKAKTYKVGYTVSNLFGITGAYEIDFTVNNYMTTGLTIQSVYHKGFYDSDVVFCAIAGNGEPPYEYSFSLNQEFYGNSPYPGIAGINIANQDYSDSNEFAVPRNILEHGGTYKLFVSVRDANCKNGQEVMTYMDFTYSLPPIA